MDNFFQYAGYIGAIFLATAYFMVANGRIESQSGAYHLANLLGAILISLNTFYFGAIGPGILNVIWAMIALYYLFKILIKAQ